MGRKYKVLYPNLREAVLKKGTIQEFIDQTELYEGGYYKILYGTVDPRKSTIDKILKYTGLTYEEAFHEEEKV